MPKENRWQPVNRRSEMNYLKKIRSVALDIANTSASYKSQDEVADVIWTLLGRGFKVYLFSTDNSDNLLHENYAHPSLVFLTNEMPPAQADIESHPELLDETTLWFTDHPVLQRWIGECGMRQVNLNENPSASPAAMRIGSVSELGNLLDPTSMMLGDIVRVVDDFANNREKTPLLIGVGGPPLSGFQKFSLELKSHLQDGEHDLVELLNLTHLMITTEDILTSDSPSLSPWVTQEIGQWVSKEIFQPLRSGSQVYLEHGPEGFPKEFSDNFPLYVNREAILIVFAELLFIPAVSEVLDITVLLEVSPEETTRRLYEIPTGDRFDAKFTAQYLKREGRIYRKYLRDNKVEEKASLRVNANKELAFRLNEPTQAPLN